MSWVFKIALGVDILAILIAFFFIMQDSIRNSSSRNGSLTLVTLGMCAWVGICYLLYKNDMKSAATAMAWIPAFPLLGYGLLVLIMVIGKPDFK